jgi:hypothetical protein
MRILCVILLLLQVTFCHVAVAKLPLLAGDLSLVKLQVLCTKVIRIKDTSL